MSTPTEEREAMSRTYQTIGAVMIAGYLLVSVQGCSKTVEATSGSKTTEQGLVKAPVTLPGEERVADDIMVAKAEAEAARQRTEEMRQEAAATAGTELQDVFFGFDSWTINDSGKQALGADAQWLKANGGKTLTIEGHCDERGTQAYNLVLGERRAKAVRSYLTDLGVDAKRLAVTSYGKDRPFCRDHNEDCHQQNRRGHLVLHVK
jgi:peptidoglycan-associated lipoprotein